MIPDLGGEGLGGMRGTPARPYSSASSRRIIERARSQVAKDKQFRGRVKLAGTLFRFRTRLARFFAFEKETVIGGN